MHYVRGAAALYSPYTHNKYAAMGRSGAIFQWTSAFARVGEQGSGWRGTSSYDPFLDQTVEEQSRLCMKNATCLQHNTVMDPFAAQTTQEVHETGTSFPQRRASPINRPNPRRNSSMEVPEMSLIEPSPLDDPHRPIRLCARCRRNV